MASAVATVSSKSGHDDHQNLHGAGRSPERGHPLATMARAPAAPDTVAKGVAKVRLGHVRGSTPEGERGDR